MKNFRKEIFLTLLFILFIFPLSAMADSLTTPLHSIDNSISTGKSEAKLIYDIDNGTSISDKILIKNFDTSRSINVKMAFEAHPHGDSIPIPSSWISFSPSSMSIEPAGEEEVTVNIDVPSNVSLSSSYIGAVISRLDGFYSSDGQMTEVAVGVGIKVHLYAENSGQVENEGNNLVYYDFDGDGVYDLDDNDELITVGTASIYDEDENLIQSTDLSETNGRYELPDSEFDDEQTLYVNVVTGKFEGGYLDPSWKGNIYVNRVGMTSFPQNAFILDGVSDYDEVTANIDLRSRNTDRIGNWGEGTMSIGPDDKDQVISPSRWDMLVSGTDFRYVDLDHDGRIDPDDKDHIISPLYWDFPN